MLAFILTMTAQAASVPVPMPTEPVSESAIAEAANFCLAENKDKNKAENKTENKTENRGDGTYLTLSHGTTITLPPSATVFSDAPRRSFTDKDIGLASSEDIPTLVRGYGEAELRLSIVGNRSDYLRFRYKSSEAWSISQRLFPICNVIVTGTANVLEQRDKILLALQKDGWTGSLPTNTVVWELQMRKLGMVKGEFQSVDQAFFRGVDASKSDGTEIQMAIEFISGKTKIQALPTK